MPMTFDDLFSQLNAVQRGTVKRLAEIEKSDAERCSHCGGEDCVCCEIYQDRQRWVDPETLFGFNEGGY